MVVEICGKAGDSSIENGLEPPSRKLARSRDHKTVLALLRLYLCGSEAL